MSLSVGCVTISYNQGKYLRSCIESVSRNDRALLRHVIVDPGSKDESRSIIEEYRARGRFHAVILDPDKGPADGLNNGFGAIGDADILCYLNSDDEFHPGALDVVCQYFQDHPTVDVITGAGVFIDENGRPQRRKRMALPFSPKAFLHDATFVMQQATFFRRSAFLRAPGFNVENRTCWDTELLVDLYLAGVRFTRVGMLLGRFRLYPGAMTFDAMNSGFSPRLVGDLNRLKEKFRTAGYRASFPPIPRLHRAANYLNPWRRAMEFLAL